MNINETSEVYKEADKSARELMRTAMNGTNDVLLGIGRMLGVCVGHFIAMGWTKNDAIMKFSQLWDAVNAECKRAGIKYDTSNP